MNNGTTVPIDRLKSPPNERTWLVILILSLFPPAALYFIWHTKHQDRFFPRVIYIHGGFILSVAATYAFFFPQQLVKAGLSTPQPTDMSTIIILMTYAVVQIASGALMKRQLPKSKAYMPRSYLWILTIIILMNSIVIFGFLPLMVLWIIFGLYILTAF